MATPPPQYGAGPHPPHAPQQGWPQGPYSVPPQQAPYGWQAPPPVPYGPAYPPPQGMAGCRFCGAYPAAHATVRGHQGFIVIMRFLSLPGPFCRDCGLSTYRRMSGDTLWQGWWGPLSFFITPVTLLMNLGPRAAFRRLPAPAGGFRPALDPGKPLWRRGPALLFLVPALLIVLGIPALIVLGLLVGDDKPPTLSPGQCVQNVGTLKDQELVVTDCGSPRAEYRVGKLLDGDRPCAAGGYLADPKYGPGGYGLSCLTPLRED
ncbi:hypothetical protein MTF65_00960 [Streptomyces sp. APSN-46.1]|uniref:LppU/SCO3897 family protein n=1 Tax=Streptomyces sp. APSN-46.1 TaxID=2929049 RepID=UPI001FB26526|nr:hypothetical protein [Streptomyces sp. APSN-46.1]MCJ1675952.1 hypothetical protein [Streptomyces sp. APSN-46.1]